MRQRLAEHILGDTHVIPPSPTDPKPGDEVNKALAGQTACRVERPHVGSEDGRTSTSEWARKAPSCMLPFVAGDDETLGGRLPPLGGDEARSRPGHLRVIVQTSGRRMRARHNTDHPAQRVQVRLSLGT